MSRITLTWQENDKEFHLPWVRETDFAPPKKIFIADDSLKAVEYYQKVSEGAAYIYKGDFQNAKQLLQAVQRRMEKTNEKKKARTASSSDALLTADDFHKYRQMQSHKARILSRLFVRVEGDLSIDLRRAPEIQDAIAEALLEPVNGPFIVSLRDLLGYIGAHEWRKKGVEISALGAKIHAHYGIFSPVRGEYLELLAHAPLPHPLTVAFDIGTGSGVIAALLAKRGATKVIATDLNPRAIACAKDNITRLGMQNAVEIVQMDLFPEGMADLIVCNPPWVPARATSRLELAVYDENSGMLKNFLKEVKQHLTSHGEAWLIMSDLAEHLGLRASGELEKWIAEFGLTVIDRLATKPKHGKAQDSDDPLYAARSKEITSLWRLRAT